MILMKYFIIKTQTFSLQHIKKIHLCKNFPAICRNQSINLVLYL